MAGPNDRSDNDGRSVVAFGSEHGRHLTGKYPFELQSNGKPLFSASELHLILFEEGKSRFVVPPAEALKPLAEKLNYIAATYHIGRNAPDYGVSVDRLTESLDYIQSWIKDRALIGSSKAWDAFLSLVSEINGLDIDPTGQGGNLGPRTSNWKGKANKSLGLDYASYCADAVNDTLISAGLGQLGRSNGGPLARIVLQILRRMTPERITLDHLSKHLKDAQAQKIGRIKG